MRLTLEQLKAMSDAALYQHWRNSEFPFEAMNCGACLTNHAIKLCYQHRHVDLVPRRLWDQGELRKNLEELYALRLFYDSLYPPSEEAPSPTEALAMNDETLRGVQA